MFFRQVRVEGMGCASYLIGADGECTVVDPRWDIDAYIRLADRAGLRITRILETHVHADHLSGNRRLAHVTGAPIFLHESAHPGFVTQPLRDGDTLSFGTVTIEVLHTPGHSPDSVTLLVRDTAGTEPDRLLTGDTLFVGDVGRPDLHGAGGAAQLYDSLARLLAFSDATEVHPGHLAGSLCGRAISAAHHTTIGAERLANDALRPRTRDEFVEYLMRELPVRPPYFEEVIRANRAGPPAALASPRPVDAHALRRLLDDNAAVVDIREPREFGEGHIPGTLSVPLYSAQFGAYVGWYVPPDKPIWLVAPDVAAVKEAVDGLAVVGYVQVAGYLEGGIATWREAGYSLATIPAVELAWLAKRPSRSRSKADALVLDVREAGEWEEGHIPGAMNIPFREVGRRLEELDRDRSLIVVCANGNRSSLAGSVLESAGFRVSNTLEGMDVWNSSGFPLEGAHVANAVPGD